MTTQATTTSSGGSRWARCGAAGLSLLLGCVGLASAQTANPAGGQRRMDTIHAAASAAIYRQGLVAGTPVSGFELVEMASAGPNQKARRGLRIRWDGATDAVRSLGVDAVECAPMLRSSGSLRRSGGLGLMLALGCKF